MWVLYHAIDCDNRRSSRSACRGACRRDCGLGRVVGEIVELPALGVDFAELLLGERKLAEAKLGLRKGRTRERAHGAPAIAIDRAMREHLEILGVMIARRLGIIERVGKADSDIGGN